jgi:hypothetical protein
LGYSYGFHHAVCHRPQYFPVFKITSDDEGVKVSALGFALLPVSVDSRRKIVLNKRWDRMEIPLPFTTVCLAFGEPIKVPAKLRDGQTREWADHLTEAIMKLDKKAKDVVCSDGR